MGRGGLLSIGYIGKQSGGVTQSVKGLCRVTVLSELPQESPGKGFLEVIISMWTRLSSDILGIWVWEETDSWYLESILGGTWHLNFSFSKLILETWFR